MEEVRIKCKDKIWGGFGSDTKVSLFFLPIIWQNRLNVIYLLSTDAIWFLMETESKEMGKYSLSIRSQGCHSKKN